MDEFPEIINIEDEQKRLLREYSARLQQVLREMEDGQLKVLALQAEAQYLNYELQEIIANMKMDRLRGKVPV